MTAERDDLLETLVALVESQGRDHPVRVGIDGKSAAGKTTLAAELAVSLGEAGRPVVQSSIDHFHPPGHRFRTATLSVQEYYDSGFDYALFRKSVFSPLDSGGDRRILPRHWDAYHDERFPEEWVTVPEDGVLVVDGACLFRQEIEDCWDLVVWLDIDNETMVQRAVERDVDWVPGSDRVERRYREHWVPFHELYERDTGAPERADVVIDNRDIDRPRIVRIAGVGEPDGGS